MFDKLYPHDGPSASSFYR